MTSNEFNQRSTTIDRTKSRLSTLWIFATLNYLYCDVVTLMDPGLLKNFLAGRIGGVPITQEFLLGAAVLVEIPISMVLLSRVLGYRSNRLANIVAGITMTTVQLLTLFARTPAPYYVFFSVIEIACSAGAVLYAWKWADNERAVSGQTKIVREAAIAR